MKDVAEQAEMFVGTGNVFADLGLPNPEERQLKACLIMEIEQAMRDEHLTKAKAAQKLGLDLQTLTELREGALSQFSINQLIGYLNCLGRDVTLSASVRERAPETAAHNQKSEPEVALV